MRIWPFRRSRAAEDAGRLLAAVQNAGRRPALFGEGRIPDTLGGRFEAMTLHASLALIRLGADPGAGPLAQAFTDQLFRHFDAGLREAAVGDLTVPKRMRKLASEFYGRLDVYGNAIASADQPALAAAVARNVGLADPFSGRVAGYLIATAKDQAEAPVSGLFEAVGWPLFSE
jgi:cytochrome b pre-mRNA-processing protein 3